MAISTAAVGGISAIGGIAKFFEGQQMQHDAQNFIKNFKPQELQNPYEHQQVSQLGSNLATEQNNIGAASNTQALRQGGTRALVAGLGQIEANTNKVNRENGANLDQQQKDINKNIAAQDVANQATVEQRQQAQLQGYGQMLSVGNQMKYGGIADIANGVGAAGTAFGGAQEAPNGQYQTFGTQGFNPADYNATTGSTAFNPNQPLNLTTGMNSSIPNGGMGMNATGNLYTPNYTGNNF